MNEMNREMRRMSERDERLAKKQTEILENINPEKKFLDLRELQIILERLGPN